MDTCRLYVTWRSPSGSIQPVGLLEQREGSPRYLFAYLKRAATLDNFTTIPGLPELDRLYEADSLFPVFQNRVMSHEREDYQRFVEQLDLSLTDEPFVVLGRSGGTRQTDRIEVFPEPLRTESGDLDSYFFVRGIRHMEGAEAAVQELQRDEALELVIDVGNDHNGRARHLVRVDGQAIGWLPDYLVTVVDELEALDLAHPQVVVARVNGPATAPHLRVLCRLRSPWPQGWRPFDRPEFQPLVEMTPGAAVGSSARGCGRQQRSGLSGRVHTPVTATAQERADKEAMKLPPETVAQYLLDTVGQRITTVALGLSDARPVREWAQGGSIRDENEARLRLLYRVARSVELIYDQETARAFLRSSNPVIGDHAPLHAIADLDEEGALDAVRLLLEP